MTNFFILILIFFLLIPLSIGIWGGLIAPSSVIVKNLNLDIPKWHKKQENFKIAIISDLHVGSPFSDMKRVDKVVELTNNQKPDLIFILGDSLNEFTIGGKFVEPEIIVNSLKNLKAKYGVIAVLGNHDWGDKFIKLKNKHKFLSPIIKHHGLSDGIKLKKAMEESNIIVLENQITKISTDNKYFWIAGISDFKTRTPDLSILDKIKDDNNPIIVITHNPDIFSSVPKYVNLSLAGHTHGGHIKIPFVGSFYLSPKTGNVYKSGYSHKDNKNIFISSGIGTSALPLRWERSEIVIINLK